MRRRTHRQERWLHTRISADLSEALKREARRRRTPISLLVRHVLENALDLVQDIVSDSMQIARAGRDETPRARRQAGDELEDVYGWQDLILNRPATCARCDVALTAGSAAYRGLSDRPGRVRFLCPACVQQLHSTTAEKEEPK